MIEKIIERLKDLILDRKSFIIKDFVHDKIFLEDIEALELAIREIEKSDEVYQYCRKQEEKINNLYHENESLKYYLSLEKLKVQEKKEELEKELEELEKNSLLEMSFRDWQIIDNTRNKIQVLKEILGEEGGE